MKMLKDHYRYCQPSRRGGTHIQPRSVGNAVGATLCGKATVLAAHNPPSKRKPLCKHCERNADKEKAWGKDIPVEPCPKCGNEGILFYNCGYSSFNPGGGKCPDCKFEVQEYVGWNDSSKKMIALWNRGVRAYNKRPEKVLENKLKKEMAKTRKLRKQLRNLGAEPVV